MLKKLMIGKNLSVSIFMRCMDSISKAFVLMSDISECRKFFGIEDSMPISSNSKIGHANTHSKAIICELISNPGRA